VSTRIAGKIDKGILIKIIDILDDYRTFLIMNINEC